MHKALHPRNDIDYMCQEKKATQTTQGSTEQQ